MSKRLDRDPDSQQHYGRWNVATEIAELKKKRDEMIAGGTLAIHAYRWYVSQLLEIYNRERIMNAQLPFFHESLEYFKHVLTLLFRERFDVTPPPVDPLAQRPEEIISQAVSFLFKQVIEEKKQIRQLYAQGSVTRRDIEEKLELEVLTMLSIALESTLMLFFT